MRLLYDQLGSADTVDSSPGQDMLDYLKEHNVQIEQRKVTERQVTHRKILTVDGTTGFIGGMNVGDDYSTRWHDIHSEVTGPAVADVQKLFVSQWTSLGGTITPAQEAALYPPLQDTGDTGARIMGHAGHQDRDIKLTYLRAIDTSKNSITIADPYVSDPDVYHHLEAAAERGVDVRLILPHTNNQPQSQDSERANYKAMLQAGVKVYEYTGRPMAHDKVAVFDHHIATIGSSNLDRIALDFNDESNVWVDDPEVAGQLDDALTHDEQTSIPVTSYRPTLKQNVENHFGDWIVSWV